MNAPRRQVLSLSRVFLGASSLLLVGVLSCGGGDDGSTVGPGKGGSGGTSAKGGSGGLNIGGSTSGGSTGTGGAPGPYKLPAGFTPTEKGGYKLGDPFNGDTPPNVGTGGSAGAGDTCGTTILGVVRDFQGSDVPGGHPDFESFSGSTPTLGMVENDLGSDQKPVYTGICEAANAGSSSCPYGQQTTTKANFDQWYRYADGVNKPYVVYFSLEPNGNVLTFQSDLFFPLDNAGWGNSGTGEDGNQHNFGFTTEVHTQFQYKGGESFTFIGDDDVWVFINNKLAVDLGGLHPSATGSIDLDSNASMLGITIGNNYNLDLFHAERHTEASHFRIDTNLAFTNCGTIVPEPPPA
jgi:fibro-slime domain-containing protein